MCETESFSDLRQNQTINRIRRNHINLSNISAWSWKLLVGLGDELDILDWKLHLIPQQHRTITLYATSRALQIDLYSFALAVGLMVDWSYYILVLHSSCLFHLYPLIQGLLLHRSYLLLRWLGWRWERPKNNGEGDGYRIRTLEYSHSDLIVHGAISLIGVLYKSKVGVGICRKGGISIPQRRVGDEM